MTRAWPQTGVRFGVEIIFFRPSIDFATTRKILGHHSILTTARYTHLGATTDTLARQRIDALMNRFALSWGAVDADGWHGQQCSYL